MKSIFTISLLLTLILPALSQRLFEVSLGKDNSNQRGNDIVESHDNGFVIVGSTKENGIDDILFIKIDKKGKTIRNQNVGNADVMNYANSICKSANNNYAVCGMTKDLGGGQEEGFFVEVDKKMSRNKLLIPFEREGSELAKNIIVLKDGGFVMSIDNSSRSGVDKYGVHDYRSDCFLIKITPEGNPVWVSDFTDIGETGGRDLVQTKDGSIYLVGIETGNSRRDIFVCKINSSGSEIWTKIIDTKVNDTELSTSIIEDKDGNLIITGVKIISKKSYPLVMKIDQNGEKLMEEYYDVGFSATANDIIQNRAGELIVVGSQYHNKGFVLHLDMKGQIIDKYILKPSISKIIKVSNEDNFVLLGEEVLKNKFRNIFVKKTNLNALKEEY